MNIFSQISFFALFTVIILTGLGEDSYSRQTTYVPEEMSRLWIEGSSNINQFECQANRYFGEAILLPNEDEADFIYEADDRIYLQVEIVVNGFECGRSRMNRDLRNALKSEEFPEIIFRFDSAEFKGYINDAADLDENEHDVFEIEVNGTLTVAGQSRKIQFATTAYNMEPRRVRAIGQTTIRMSDFDVEPPTALMGLVRADDELTVSFDLFATETEQICQLCPHLSQ